jgi:hypothetical protein
MSAQLQTRVQAAPKPSLTSAPTELVQRKCACGGSPTHTGECEECEKKKQLAVQSYSLSRAEPARLFDQPLASSAGIGLGHNFSRLQVYAHSPGAVQTKLAVGEPGDQYEQEADRIADQVLGAPAHPAVSGAPPRIQRFSGQSNGQADAAPASVDQALASPGAPLEPALRQDMEQRFGHDFARVRVHTDGRAAESARAVNALAYTVGRDIVFGEGQYAPKSQRGRELIVHELAHTIQQRGTTGFSPEINSEGVFESSAEAAGRAVANGQPIMNSFPTCGIGLARAPVPPDEWDDPTLARELQQVNARLKQASYPGRDRDVDWAMRLRFIVQKRTQAKQPVVVVPPKPPTAPAPPPPDPAAERAKAVAEAEAVAARIDDDLKDDDNEEPEPTPMALSGKSPALPSTKTKSRKRAPRKTTDSRFLPGGFTDDDIYKETEAASKRIDEKIAKDREISITPYKDRLQRVRIKLQKKSDYWYSRNEAFSRMTGEEVWNEGISDDLFIESEKKAVYEDQNSLQQYIQEQMEEDRKRARAKFESDQYQAWVAKGKQLSAPQTIIQPFLVAAAAPELVAAAYFGAQSGEMAGDLYNACAHGSDADCAAAAAQVAAAVALHRVTRVKPGEAPVEGKPLSPDDPNLSFPRGTDVTNRSAFSAPAEPTAETTSMIKPSADKPPSVPKDQPMRLPPGRGKRATYTSTEKTGTQHKESIPTVETLPRKTVPMTDFEPPEPGHYIRRKPPSVETQPEILTRAGRTTDGRLRDANTGRALDEGEAVWGHAPNYQFKEMRDMAEKLRWSQEQFDEFFEDPTKWQVEYGPSNSSRVFDRIPRQRPIH